jgi:hypothetical protein
LALFQNFTHLFAHGAGGANNGDVIFFLFHDLFPDLLAIEL